MLLLPLQLFDRSLLLESADEGEKTSPGFKVAKENLPLVIAINRVFLKIDS